MGILSYFKIFFVTAFGFI